MGGSGSGQHFCSWINLRIILHLEEAPFPLQTYNIILYIYPPSIDLQLRFKSLGPFVVLQLAVRDVLLSAELISIAKSDLILIFSFVQPKKKGSTILRLINTPFAYASTFASHTPAASDRSCSGLALPFIDTTYA